MMNTMNDLIKTSKNTTMTMMQVQYIKRFVLVLPFIADMTQAQISIYAAVAGGRRFVVLAHAMPHTALMGEPLTEAGDVVPRIEEPLIERTFETGRSMRGRREWEIGAPDYEMITLPIHDALKGGVIAVMSLERQMTDERDRHDELLRTTKLILENVHVDVNEAMMSPIKANDAIIIADGYDRIIYANEAAIHIFRVLGVVRLIGMPLFDLALSCHVTRETVSRDRPFVKEVEAGGRTILYRSVKIEAGGTMLRHIIVATDVTEIRKKEHEIRVKSAVIKEIHHRVKNNLQTIASLLRLQARRSKEQSVKDALQEAVNRILSISVVHEFLSQESSSNIDVKKITGNILDMLRPMMLATDFNLKREFTGDDIVLPSDMGTNMALVINELIINAIEHAFEGRSEGLIGLDVKSSGEGYAIDLYDDGGGLPDDFDIARTKSLGLSIVKMLIEDDLGGTFALESGDGGGTHAKMTIPRDRIIS